MVNHVDDKDDFEDEFEFDLDDEFDNDETEEEKPSAAAQVVADRGKKKFPWLIAVLAAGAVGFGGYKFVQMGDSSEQVGDISQSPAPEQTAQPISEPQVAPPAVAPSFSLDNEQDSASAPLDNQLDSLSKMADNKPSSDSFFGSDSQDARQTDKNISETTPEIEKSLANLKKELVALTKASKNAKDNEKDIELTASKIINIDKSLGGLKQDITQLTRIVKSLVEQVNDLQAARSQLQAARAAKARHSGKAKSSAPKNYVSDSMTIHAIIPGRAWLRTQAGKTVSVTEGDMLGEYGKVLKIDAPTGSVITSSGVTIR